MSILEVKHLDVAYGQIQVLWDINVEVNRREVVAIVGSNGAGKTTLLKSIAGVLKPMDGEIMLDGTPITALSPDVRVKHGISLVPEGRQLFFGMTVKQNLMMGAYSRDDSHAEITSDLDYVFELFPRLKERQTQIAGTLSGGEQQMCAIGRSLMAAPKVLLIDEMSLGLAPMLVDSLIVAIQQVHERGVTIVLVEQDVETAFTLADRAYVLETGNVAIDGPSSELRMDARIKATYLGL